MVTWLQDDGFSRAYDAVQKYRGFGGFRRILPFNRRPVRYREQEQPPNPAAPVTLSHRLNRTASLALLGFGDTHW
jgi:hypothetical protein